LTRLDTITSTPQDQRPSRAAAVVYRLRKGHTEFLLVSRNSDPSQFVLPAGHIDPGESPQQAAQRECYEESGVHIHIQSHLSHYNHIKRRGNVKPTRVYLATPLSIAPSPEGRHTRWVRIKDILADNRNTPNYVLDLLKQANKHLPKPARAA
jgi:8-oxo-dGTP pyrophosphatase MutT (NUDIX family)